MGNQVNRKNSFNCIKDAEKNARELFGYDDDTLLREFKEAEQELLQQKDEGPELEEKLAMETNDGFDALMAKIRKENLKPVTEAEYEANKKEEERKIVFLKPMLKVLFVAAAVVVVLMGMGGGVSAKRAMEYQKVRWKNEIILSDGEHRQDTGSLENAYTKINDEMGIEILKLGYQPKGLQLVDLTLDKGHAVLAFEQGKNRVFLRETKYPVDSLSEGVISDRRQVSTVYNSWLNTTLEIEENSINGEFYEYSAELTKEGAYYYLTGNIANEEFAKMVKNLKFD